MFVDFEAKVKRIGMKLVEPKDGSAYTATEIVLLVESELSPTELGQLSQLQRGKAALVTIERDAPQAELFDGDGQVTEDAAAAEPEGDEFREVEEPEDTGQELVEEHA